jgi:hypothetical protein
MTMSLFLKSAQEFIKVVDISFKKTSLYKNGTGGNEHIYIEMTRGYTHKNKCYQ